MEKTFTVVRVSPAVASLCGAPADARTMIVRALGEFRAEEGSAQSIELGQSGSFSIDRFPANTQMLEVEVRGFGGELRAVGRSLEFSMADLADGAEIPVFMAPEDGVCPTGPAQSGRVAPLLARSGRSVLMAGGVDAQGSPVLPLERYNLSEGAFETIATPLYADTSPLGLQGASMTELSNGDVVVVGGAATAYQVYRSETEELLSPSFYREARGYHAAVAMPEGRIFLAGGCSQLVSGGCMSGAELLTTSILDPESGSLQAGPQLQLPRVKGRAFVDGGSSIVLVGGEDLQGRPVVQAERVFLDSRPSELIDLLQGSSTLSPAGTIWAGLAAAGQEASLSLSALPPQQGQASSGYDAAFADSDARLVTLEDGSMLAFGVEGAQRIRSFDGATSDLQIAALQGREGQSGIRLLDGTVLIVGGGQGGPTNEAFIYRPRLVGPLSASMTYSFSSPERSEGLSARDPNRVELIVGEQSYLLLNLAAAPEEWLIASGPHFKNFHLEASLASESGSALLYFAWQSPRDHWKLILSGGTTAQLVQVVDSVEQVLTECKGEALAALSMGPDSQRPHEVSLSLGQGELLLAVDQQQALSCVLDVLPEAGQVGIGIRGTLGQQLRVDIISIER